MLNIPYTKYLELKINPTVFKTQVMKENQKEKGKYDITYIKLKKMVKISSLNNKKEFVFISI